MTGLSTTQLDEFLVFSNLFLLQIHDNGQIETIRPNYRNFLGWDNTNISQFNLNSCFLEPNQLNWNEFNALFEISGFTTNTYLWKDANGKLSAPLPTFFKQVDNPKQTSRYLAFVKNPVEMNLLNIPIPEKKYIFQGKAFPGLIHNINGPLGTLTGRVELLQYKYPDITELEEVIRVGFRLQNILENVSFKIVNEKSTELGKINLNRFLREEITFLNSDLFFKHQVEKVPEYSNNIPEFYAEYSLLSGIFQEIYFFFRNYVNEQREYVFIVKSFSDDVNIGFSLEFMGDFEPVSSGFPALPFRYEGDFLAMSRLSVSGLDTRFLSHAIRHLMGNIIIIGRPDEMKCRFTFPIKYNMNFARD